MCVKHFVCVFVYSLIIWNPFNESMCHGSTIGHEIRTHDFAKYSVVRPKLLHPRLNQSLEPAQQETGLHADFLILTYFFENSEVIIDLQLNTNLFPQDHFLSYENADGAKVVKNFTKADIEVCHYHGTVRGSTNSNVAISTCNGINGVILDEHNEFHILSGPERKVDSDHFLYRYSDIIENDTKDQTNTNFLRAKRSFTSSDNSLHPPYNSNKNSSYIELVIVVDNGIFSDKKHNLSAVYSYTLDVANILYSLYVPLNIFIALKGVVVWTWGNKIEIDVDSNLTLDRFADYRSSYLINDFPNDNAQLLTNVKFGAFVGYSYKKSICSTLTSVAIISVNDILSDVAATMAHELGHNLGMEHDTNACKCVDKSCLMESRQSLNVPKHWSTCSVDQLNLSFKRGLNHCLKNKPVKLFKMSSCGNGFIETGEQCDCGTPNICFNSCCNPETCMLSMNASCATGECCDLTTCQLRRSDFECQKSDNECQLSQYCSGNSEYCPNNMFVRDTEPCKNGEAYCYNGECKTHTDQCKQLWGSAGKAMLSCHVTNTNGSAYGNCGYDQLKNTYIPCNKHDILCGLLHCKHVCNELQYGNSKNSWIKQTKIISDGGLVSCRTIFELGMDTRDPVLAPDGAKCGDNKMCIKQKCVSVDDLRERGIGTCPEHCNGNGKCDIFGNCHCLPGFDPPFCKGPVGNHVCSENCNGNGDCTKEGKCHCFPGFQPPTCAKVIAQPCWWLDNCNRNGRCNIENRCDCFFGYLPPSCKYRKKGILGITIPEKSPAVRAILVTFISISTIAVLVYYILKKFPQFLNRDVRYTQSNI